MNNWIRTQLTVIAQVITRNLLHYFHTMSYDLYNFIRASYEDTMHSGKFDSNPAWKLTISFLRKIFTEVGYNRVSARDTIKIDSPWTSGSGILFSNIHAYSIMSKFMHLSIKYHPIISSDMVKFVCYSHPSTNNSEFLTRISAVKYLQHSNQSQLSKLDNRLKKLEYFNTKAEKSINNLKKKIGI